MFKKYKISALNLLIVANVVLTPLISVSIFNFKVHAQEFVTFERFDLRTPYAKVYQTGEKSFKSEVSSAKIHYGSPGNYYDINNNIIFEQFDKYSYRNAANDYIFRAGHDIATGVYFSGFGKVCEFKLDSIPGINLNNSTAVINNNKITYPNIYPNADLEFTAMTNGIGTEIIAKDPSAFKPQFKFELTDCNYTTFDTPKMYDKDSMSHVSQNVINEDGVDKLVLNPDYSSLGNINGPVKIDPSITDAYITEDVFVSPDTPDGNRHALLIGQYTDCTIGCQVFNNSKALMRFDMSVLPADGIVTSAYLNIQQYASENFTGTNVIIRQIDAGWNEGSQYSMPTSGDYGTNHIPYYIIGVHGPDVAVRSIEIVPSFVQSMKTNNNGLSLEAQGLNDYGLTFCAANVPLAYQGYFCGDGSRAPRITINYVTNQNPYTPANAAPATNSVYSGNCDESAGTGICRTTQSVTLTVNGVGDGDTAPGDLKHTIFYADRTTTSGTTSSSSAGITGSGTVNYVNNWQDGQYSWRARSEDNMGALGNYSNATIFTTDTTPPAIPAANSLPQFTQGVGISSTVQVEPTANITTDNVSAQNQIWYKVQYSTSSDFSSNVFEKPWQQNDPSFEIGPKGADNIAGNGDDIIDGNTYYFRFKAADNIKINQPDLNNISNWSSIISTTIDGTKPSIANYDSNLDRFSPNNATSIGDFDTLNISFDYTEVHPNSAQINIYDSTNTLIRTMSQDISANEGTATPVNLNFIWDGKNDSTVFLGDGVYSARVTVTDKAGNVNDATTDLLLIIDNNEANITISSPINNFWTNAATIAITGQVKSPNDPNEEDSDLSQFSIFNLQNSLTQNITWDASDIFSVTELLTVGQNDFELKTIDTVANEKILNWTVFRDTTAPNVSSITPNSLINNTQPTIAFSASDSGTATERSDIPTGTNPAGMEVWLTFPTWNGFMWQVQTKKLIENGVNLETALVNDLSCTADASATTSTKNNKTSADIVNCSLNFIVDLQPDTEYTLHIKVADNAGNEDLDENTSFILDSHTFSEVYAPVNGGVYSTSSVIVKGKTSKGNTLTITNDELAQTRNFVVNESLNGTGQDSFITSNFTVICGEFIDIDSRTDTPDEEACSYEVKVAQSFVNTDIDTTNHNHIISTDPAGNIFTHDITTTVNLYNFDLQVSSDLQYFSPNGDGNQDGIMFTHTAVNSTDPSNPPLLQDYTLQILDASNNPVTSFTGSSFLPLNTLWDGKAGADWVADGEYRYTLSVTTTDGAIVTTAPKSVFAKTVLLDEVIITYPVNGGITTEGVITVQGQAPTQQETDVIDGSLRGVVYVIICIDTITVPNDVACDNEQVVQANDVGFFSTILVLPTVPGQTQTQHNITAKAFDNFGNRTDNSNLVTLTYDTVDPFNFVNITPALTGISTDAQYQDFLNGVISIDQIRTVILEANVSQNTEQVEMSFANYINVDAKPGSPSFNYIATLTDLVDSSSQTNPWNDSTIRFNHNKALGDPTIPVANCNSAIGCSWKYVFPIAPTFGGIYEVKFKGLKGSTIQEMTAGFKADGSIPAAPIIMVVEKQNLDGSYSRINSVDDIYFTNSTQLRLRGAAEPGSTLELYDGTTFITNITVQNSGIWEFNVDLSTLLGGNNLQDFDFNIVTADPLNPVAGVNRAYVRYDNLPPVATNISRTTPVRTIPGWVKTGDNATYTLTSNKSLQYSDLIKEDLFAKLLSTTNVTNDNWVGTINIDRTTEGNYNPLLRLVDYSGNKTEYDATLWPTYGLGDFRIYIDNTLPDATTILKPNWGIAWEDGGVNATTDPERGRTNPEYVTRDSKVTISGKAEANQRVELYVNNQFHSFINVSVNNCQSLISDTVATDGLVVKYGSVCDWSYDYVFPDNGANDQFGVPLNGYLFQVRTIDMAANVSTWSKQELIYHDAFRPNKPVISKAISPSYSPIVEWHSSDISGGLPVTKDINVTLTSLAERFADVRYVQTNPNASVINHPIFINDASRIANRPFTLGSQSDDRDGCVAMENGRRKGICEDGIYKFTMTATDAAGQTSDATESLIERDTVKPAEASPELIVVRQTRTLDLKINNAEPNAIAKIKVWGQGKVWYYSTQVSGDGSIYLSNVIGIYYPAEKYTVEVRIEDRAKNMGSASYFSVTTPAEGFCIEGGSTRLTFPVRGDFVRSSNGDFYAARIFDDGTVTQHNAQDFTYYVDPYSQPIYAAGPGKITFIGTDNYGALWIDIYHEELEVTTRYLHMSSFNQDLVDRRNRGETVYVDINTVLGLMGSTGWSTGLHLHFEVILNNGARLDPMTYLGECRGYGPEVINDGVYPGSKKAEAVNKFKDFIRNDDKSIDKIEDAETIVQTSWQDSGKKVSTISNLDVYLNEAVHEWCGVWVVDFEKVKERNGNSGYDALAVMNPWDKQIYLLKNGIWDKYRKENGPCSPIGIPKQTGNKDGNEYAERKAGRANNSIALSNKAFYQRFETADYKNQSIYWYETNNGSNGYYTIHELSNKYENTNGSTGIYGFPTGDTYPGVGYEINNKTYCKQWFEFNKEINDCGTVPTPPPPPEDNSPKGIIYKKEKELGNVTRDGGIQEMCGIVVQHYTTVGSYGDSIIMYNPEDKKAYIVTGGLWWSYYTYGGCARFSYPKMDPSTTGSIDGWYQNFKNATIYWSKDKARYPKSQPGIVEGAVRNYYDSLHGTNSFLGFPEGEKFGVYANNASVCGTKGNHQNFTWGKIYVSDIGNAAWRYSEYQDYYWSKHEFKGDLGWPKAGIYNNSTNIPTENGRIFKKDGKITHKIEGGCIDNPERKNDPDNAAAKLIHKKEEELGNYERVNDGNGIGAVHLWTCGSYSQWVADYDTVGGFGRSIIVANIDKNEAFLITGKILEKYWSYNGCEKIGKPTTNGFSEDKIKEWGPKDGFTKHQVFERGDIYHYSIPGFLNTDEKTFVIEEKVRSKYNSSNGLEGNYEFVDSDIYNKTKNNVSTRCQSFDGFDNAEICEIDIPSDNTAQRKLEDLLGYRVDLSQIEENYCGNRSKVNINGGIAYYDPNWNNAQKITGEIYNYWNTNGGCGKYGLPHFSTTDIEKDGKKGQWQRFQKDNLISDFYYTSGSEYGVKVLEGVVRNMFNAKGGFNKLGFPKDTAIHNTSIVCVKDNLPNGKFINVQIGRIYDNNGNWYHVDSSNSVGEYFFDNGADGKFGLPIADEEGGGFLSDRKQKFQLATIIDPYGAWAGAKADKELDKIYCPSDKPVEPTPTPTPTPVTCTPPLVLENGKCVEPAQNIDNSKPVDVISNKLSYTATERPVIKVKLGTQDQFWLHIMINKDSVDGSENANNTTYWEKGYQFTNIDHFTVIDSVNRIIEVPLPELKLWQGSGDVTIYYRVDTYKSDGSNKILTESKSFNIAKRNSEFVFHRSPRGVETMAKILNAPYINQWLSEDGGYPCSEYNQWGSCITPSPGNAWQRCGSAAITMALAYYNKVNGNYSTLQSYVNEDSVWNQPAQSVLTQIPLTCNSYGGVFGRVTYCDEQYWGLNKQFTASIMQGEFVKDQIFHERGEKSALEFYRNISNVINNGGFIHQGIGDYIGHQILIVGYGVNSDSAWNPIQNINEFGKKEYEYSSYIVNDSYDDLYQDSNSDNYPDLGGYSLAGNKAVYYWGELGWTLYNYYEIYP